MCLFTIERQAKTVENRLKSVKRISKTCENKDEGTDISKHKVVEECEFVMSERTLMTQAGSLMAACS